MCVAPHSLVAQSRQIPAPSTLDFSLRPRASVWECVGVQGVRECTRERKEVELAWRGCAQTMWQPTAMRRPIPDRDFQDFTERCVDAVDTRITFVIFFFVVSHTAELAFLSETLQVASCIVLSTSSGWALCVPLPSTIRSTSVDVCMVCMCHSRAVRTAARSDVNVLACFGWGVSLKIAEKSSVCGQSVCDG